MLILSEEQVDIAADFLLQGFLVAFPTETVYGLAAPISNAASIEKIFEIKNRPLSKPLIIHISHIDQAIELTKELSLDFYRLTDRFFPGPLTLVLKKGDRVPLSISRGGDTVAIRMPRHPVALKLIQKLGEPIVGTSANLSGKPSSTTVEHVIHDFPSKVKAVIDGGSTPYGIESTVLSLKDSFPRLLRPGAIPISALENVLDKRIEQEITAVQNPPYRYHVIGSRLTLFTTEAEVKAYLNSRSSLSKYFLMATQPIPGFYHLTLQNFYALLRLANQLESEEIIVLYHNTENTFPLVDRLKKAQALLER